MADPPNAPSAYSFDKETDNFEVEDDTSTYEVTVQATSTSSVDRMVNIMVDEDATTADANQYSFSPTVTIPAGQLTGSTTLNFDYSILQFGDTRSLVFDLDLMDDQTINLARTSFALSFVKQCTLNEVVLDITFDDYPGETSWELYDLSTGVDLIASGGDYGGLTSIQEIFCLESGDYGFVIYDQFGDGICCAYGNGSYSLTANGTVIQQGGSFGGNESTTFSL